MINFSLSGSIHSVILHSLTSLAYPTYLVTSIQLIVGRADHISRLVKQIDDIIVVIVIKRAGLLYLPHKTNTTDPYYWITEVFLSAIHLHIYR